MLLTEVPSHPLEAYFNVLHLNNKLIIQIAHHMECQMKGTFRLLSEVSIIRSRILRKPIACQEHRIMDSWSSCRVQYKDCNRTEYFIFIIR
jgi:hypothetical protein